MGDPADLPQPRPEPPGQLGVVEAEAAPDQLELGRERISGDPGRHRYRTLRPPVDVRFDRLPDDLKESIGRATGHGQFHSQALNNLAIKLCELRGQTTG